MSTPNVREPQRVAVVGGGISGLTAALRLERTGYDVELIERGDVLGGRFGVAKLGDRPVMMGGKNIGRKYSSVRDFIGALGNHPWEPFGINASRVKNGKVLTLDSTRRTRTLQNIWRMGQPRDIAKLAQLAARIRANPRNGFLGAPYFEGLGRKYDHAPLASHFGAEVSQHLLRALTVRMNGAEPEEVYLGTFGTNLSLLMDTYDQLSGGVQPALEEFARRVQVRLGATVDGLILRDGVATGLRITNVDGSSVESHYDGIIIATPAYATAEIVRDTRPALAERLDEVHYFPSTVVLTEYDRPVFNADVRALAMDEGPCSNAGSYGMEDRHIVRYTFSGVNGRNVDDPASVRMKEWIGETEDRLIKYLGIGRALPVRTVTRHWPAAYCGYLPFHGDFLSGIRRSVGSIAGLELAGDYLWGVSLEACSRSGGEAAGRLGAHLERSATSAAL